MPADRSHLMARGVQVDSTTRTEQFQRVFFWRWRAPEGQTVFTLHVPELERTYEEARAKYEEDLDRDEDLEPPPQQTLPYPGLGQHGGNYGREQPQLSLLVACTPPKPTRLDVDTGWGDASPAVLAKRLEQVASHTGRPKGLSPGDYAAQREWTIARSLSWEFFENCVELPGAPVVWRDRYGDAAQVLGFLLWARRLGRHGVTLSGPQWATVLHVGIATVWRWMRRLEQAGLLIRLHRWKPGRGKRPVALTGNWYGLGPVALATIAELEAPQNSVKKARLRVRRLALRAQQRREGRQLLRGYAYPDQDEWVAAQLRGTERGLRRDEERWTDFQAGVAPSDFTTTHVPSFVVTWEFCFSNGIDDGRAATETSCAPLAPVPSPVSPVSSTVEAALSAAEAKPETPRTTTPPSPPAWTPGSNKSNGGPATARRDAGGEVHPSQSTDHLRESDGSHESVSAASEIPISRGIGAPGSGLKPERNGPEWAKTRPPMPSREHPPPSANAAGPLERGWTVAYRNTCGDETRAPEPGFTAPLRIPEIEADLAGVHDPNLQAILRRCARARFH